MRFSLPADQQEKQLENPILKSASYTSLNTIFDQNSEGGVSVKGKNRAGQQEDLNCGAVTTEAPDIPTGVLALEDPTGLFQIKELPTVLQGRYCHHLLFIDEETELWEVSDSPKITQL